MGPGGASAPRFGTGERTRVVRVQKSAAIGGKKAGRWLLGVIKIECIVLSKILLSSKLFGGFGRFFNVYPIFGNI